MSAASTDDVHSPAGMLRLIDPVQEDVSHREHFGVNSRRVVLRPRRSVFVAWAERRQQAGGSRGLEGAFFVVWMERCAAM
jgi:hypothetical protein